jgi:hypothetical protein
MSLKCPVENFYVLQMQLFDMRPRTSRREMENTSSHASFIDQMFGRNRNGREEESHHLVTESGRGGAELQVLTWEQLEARASDLVFDATSGIRVPKLCWRRRRLVLRLIC